MNTLGASAITCESFREVTSVAGSGSGLGRGPSLTQQRIENSGFDFRHRRCGQRPRDPRPLRWPDEPGFSAAVSSVLENGATEVVINIKSNRTHAIDGTLGIWLKKVGFDLGGGLSNPGSPACTYAPAFPAPKKSWR